MLCIWGGSFPHFSVTYHEVTLYRFARAFQLHTVLYHLMYPHFLYPATNIALAASIFFTVSLGLER